MEEIHFNPLKVTSYQSTNLEKKVKFYVPTCSLFAGPVTFWNVVIPQVHMSKITMSQIYKHNNNGNFMEYVKWT